MAIRPTSQFRPFTDMMFTSDPSFMATMVDIMSLPASMAAQNTELMFRMSLLPMEIAQDVLKSGMAAEGADGPTDVGKDDTATDRDVFDENGSGDTGSDLSGADETAPESEGRQTDRDDLMGDPVPGPVLSADADFAVAPETSPMHESVQAPAEADNLQAIRGIGPKLVGTLAEMGITQYAQIAAWTPQQVQDMQAKLKDARGRPATDDWVSQAQALVKS